MPMTGGSVLLPGSFYDQEFCGLGNFASESSENPIIMCPYLSLTHWLHSCGYRFHLHLDTMVSQDLASHN